MSGTDQHRDRTSPHSDRTYHLAEILLRIDGRLEKLNRSARWAGVRAGLSPDFLRNLKRQYQEGRQVGMKFSTLKQLANALGTSTGWLITGTGDEEVQVSAPVVPRRQAGARLIGEVAPGRWLEGANINLTQPDFIPPDPRYPAESQFAVIVRGTSANNVAADGDYLLCLDHNKAGGQWNNGDLVIVKREQQGLVELTARRVVRGGGHLVLSFDSHDPNHSAVTTIVPTSEREVTVEGIVLWVQRPIPRPSLSSVD